VVSGRPQRRTSTPHGSLRRTACTLLVALLAGCRPMQPYYLHEDGDLSHYLDVATQIEYPDVAAPPLPEVTEAYQPNTITDLHFDSVWELTLEEAVSIALHNTKTIRTFGNVRQFAQIVAGPPERLVAAADSISSVYDVAIQESSQQGVEQVLANFDAIFRSSTQWESFDRQQNFVTGQVVNSPDLQQDVVNVTNELAKLTATGTQFVLRNVNTYTGANNLLTRLTRAVPSDWFVAWEAEARQPLLRGRGTQVNRLPVVVARIRSDIALTDFEAVVHNLLNEVERAYWELYFFYHNLDAAIIGRDSALGIWKKVHPRFEEGAPGGEAEKEAQAREQYFFFRSRVEEALRDVLRSENRLRFLLGLAATDGRLIRPTDEPTKAKLSFDWHAVQCEALIRRPGLRRQKWRIKQREMELIAARNQLLPQLDAIGLYRWLGTGAKYDSWGRNGENFPDPNSTAVDQLFEGNFQEFRLGLELELPIGFRREMAQVRNVELLLVREKARLEDMELEVSHQMADGLQNLDAQYQLMQTNMNRLIAAQNQVDAVVAAYEVAEVPFNVILDAQRQRADAQVRYYQSLVEYNLTILEVHFRKGTITDYHNVAMAEGPWPAKAYFDAQNLARQRDASIYLDYGFTRPNVISRGPVDHLIGPTVEAHNEGFEEYPEPVPASEAAEDPFRDEPAAEDPSGELPPPSQPNDWYQDDTLDMKLSPPEASEDPETWPPGEPEHETVPTPSRKAEATLPQPGAIQVRISEVGQSATVEWHDP
jgi:outer membrane protein TolC